MLCHHHQHRVVNQKFIYWWFMFINSSWQIEFLSKLKSSSSFFFYLSLLRAYDPLNIDIFFLVPWNLRTIDPITFIWTSEDNVDQSLLLACNIFSLSSYTSLLFSWIISSLSIVWFSLDEFLSDTQRSNCSQCFVMSRSNYRRLFSTKISFDVDRISSPRKSLVDNDRIWFDDTFLFVGYTKHCQLFRLSLFIRKSMWSRFSPHMAERISQ